MGLLDVLNGMQQGQPGSSTPTQQQGAMSPMTLAILGLLAWKAIRHFAGSGTASQGAGPTPQPIPGGAGLNPGDILKNGLGGLLAGGTAGTVLSGGLSDLVKQLQNGGQGEAANSWVSGGPNKSISPSDLSSALGADQIDQLSQQSGLSRDNLLNTLSQYLPQVVDHLTPDGRLPTDDEVSGRL